VGDGMKSHGFILRTDGAVENCAEVCSISRIRELINAPSGLDTVSLHHLGPPLMVMLIDDTGFLDGRPVNPKATALYHANCLPGTTHPICGDVFICPDDDFA
jgi:hypothetical protein